jgi:hypothetical protein
MLKDAVQHVFVPSFLLFVQVVEQLRENIPLDVEFRPVGERISNLRYDIGNAANLPNSLDNRLGIVGAGFMLQDDGEGKIAVGHKASSKTGI